MTNGVHIGDEQVQAYLEGLLPKSGADAVEGHLSECPGCRELAESYRSLSTALGRLDRPAPPAGFTAGVLERIETHQRAEARTSIAILGVSVVLASTLLVMAGPAAWRAALSSASGFLGSVTSALHLGVNILLPMVNALQLEILIVFGSVALLLSLCLSRILPARSPRSR